MNQANILMLFSYNIIISITYAAIYIFLMLISFGYKDKINKKDIFTFILALGFFDAVATTLFDQYGSLQTFIDPIITVLLLVLIFKIELLSSLVMSFIGIIAYVVLVVLYSLGTQFLFNYTLSSPNAIPLNEWLYNLELVLLFYLLTALFLCVISKKNIKLINLRQYKAFNKKSSSSNKNYDTIKLLAIIAIPVFIFIFLNYSIYYYDYLHRIFLGNYQRLSFIYFTVNSFAIVFSSIITFLLVKKILKLNFIESEYKLQKSYTNNVDRLLNDLRAQRHGFNNHVQILFSLLQSNKYNSAKEYISKMHQVISINNDVLSVNNPTLCALLSIKTTYANDNNVKLEINVDNDLSDMSFSAFELVEALGNVIDNAIEAALVWNKNDKYVRINISSDNNNYIFSVENSGETIPSNIISKLFEEGFTTKEQESRSHGFGLYVCKSIVEAYYGKIDVTSQNNITNFKIFLPKVIKNEFRLS